jgi:protein gp37
MSATSKIEWTDATWNPVRGCSIKSPGCFNCYAPYAAVRLMGAGKPYDGLVERGDDGRMRWTGTVRIVPEKLDEPLRWREPKMIFVNSMSDLFHEEVPDEYIAATFGVMGAAYWHTFQILTKRAERLPRWFEWFPKYYNGPRRNDLPWYQPKLVKLLRAAPPHEWPCPNVWLGVSAENQKTADERIPHLLATPAAVRFLSVEPLLGPVDLSPWLFSSDGFVAGRDGPRHRDDGGRSIDWVIVGGESGVGARPMHPSWVRSIRDQCQAAGVPFFFKQWGEYGPDEALPPMKMFEKRRFRFVRPDGGDRTHNADGTFSGDSPKLVDATMYRVGKRAAGRVLDGRTWDEMPEVATR